MCEAILTRILQWYLQIAVLLIRAIHSFQNLKFGIIT